MKKLILFLILAFVVPCQAQLQCIIKVPATEKLKTEIIDSKRVDNTTLSITVKEKFFATKSDTL